MERYAWILLSALLVTACDSGEDSPIKETSSDMQTSSETGSASGMDTETDTETELLRGPCPRESKLGSLEVSVTADYSSISGTFNDSVVPASVPTLEKSLGDCVLLKRRNPVCNPACEASFTCNFEGTCIPYPTQQDVGIVTIDGLAEPVALEPIIPGNNYFKTDLNHPTFQPGSPISVTTTDGYFGSLSLNGVGVDPLVNTELNWTVSTGTPISVTWPVPTAQTGSRIALTLNIDQHGSSPLTLSCDFADTGAAEIPATLVDALLNAGVSGFPNGRLTRRTVDATDVSNGCIELLVTSSLKAKIETKTK